MVLLAECALILSGFFVFVRVLDKLRTKKYLKQAQHNKILIGNAIGVAILLLTFGLGSVLISVGALLPALFLWPLLLLQEKRKSKKLDLAIVQHLQVLILRMSAGHSLAAASKISAFDVDYPVEPTSRQQMVQRELKEIESTPHQALARLRILREQLVVQDQFSKQKQKITAQIRAQAGLLSFLYLGLIVFIFNKYRFSEIQTFFSFSFLLFVVGLVALMALERSFRWKV